MKKILLSISFLWYVESERTKSFELDYTRNTQRQYRHKIFKNHWINESYVHYPRPKKKDVLKIYMDIYKYADIFMDNGFYYISSNQVPQKTKRKTILSNVEQLCDTFFKNNKKS